MYYKQKDGELAVIHDLKLKRLANANVHVSDLTMEELRQLTLSQDGFQDKSVRWMKSLSWQRVKSNSILK